MFFGEVRTQEAEGLILAHSLRLPQSVFKKGRVLSAADVKLLKDSGINFVTGARLDPTDMGEDETAGVLARALAGQNMAANVPFTGRCNLFAESRGLLVYDRDRMDRLNMVDEAITLAAIEPYQVVAKRQMLATIKIIPFGVDSRVVDACLALASTGGPLMHVIPFKPLDVALIHTTLPGLKESVVTSTAQITRARVEALEGRVTQEITCPHDVGHIERAIHKAIQAGTQLILITGASATVDRRDVVPSAIVRQGGVIDHFGMPVDPGNLLLLGCVGGVSIVNLPGCARSAKPNGLDWILQRIAARVPIRPQDIMKMGAGGLLKELGSRPRHELTPPAPVTARLAALIYANHDPSAMVELALAAGLDPVVVANPPNDEWDHVLPSCEVVSVSAGLDQPNQWLEMGLKTLSAEIDGAIVISDCAGNMGVEGLQDIMKAFDPAEGRAILKASHRDQTLPLVLLSRKHFGALIQQGIDAFPGEPQDVYEVILG